MNSTFARHVDFAMDMFAKHPRELSSTMVKFQLKLPDRQCRIAELSQRVQDTVTILVTALYANRVNNEVVVAAADVLCDDLRRKLTGERPSDVYFRKTGVLADMIIEGRFEGIHGLPTLPILRPYPN